MDIQKIQDFLTQEGYRAKLEADGDLSFKNEGKYYVIQCPPHDAAFIRLCAPNLWKIESEEEWQECRVQANAATCGTKCAKVYVTDKPSVWATLETFLPDEAAFTAVFYRCLSALDRAVSRFHEGMEAWRAAQPEGVDTGTEQTAPLVEEPEQEAVLYKYFRNLCLSGHFDHDTLNAFLKVLESDANGDAVAKARGYLDRTKAEARQALETDDVDFLDIEFPERSDLDDLEEAYRLLWNKAKNVECVQSMAAIRLSMMEKLGKERQSELIGLWR